MKSSLSILAFSVAASPVYSNEHSFSFYGVADLSAVERDINYAKNDNINNDAIKNNASRFGVEGNVRQNNDLDVIYRIEYGVRLPSENKDETVFLRELYTGVKNSFGVAKLGFINTPFKLSQHKVDVFSDVVDMNNLISGENVEDMINITTSRFYGASINASYVIDDPTNDSDIANNGHSVSINYQNSATYLALAHDSYGKRDSATRFVAEYKAKSLYFGLLVQHQTLVDTDIDDQEGLVASVSYTVGNYTLKGRAIKSDMNEEVKSFYGLAREEVKSLTLGLDYKTGEKSKVHVYTMLAETEADNRVVDVGIGIRIDF